MHGETFVVHPFFLSLSLFLPLSLSLWNIHTHFSSSLHQHWLVIKANLMLKMKPNRFHRFMASSRVIFWLCSRHNTLCAWHICMWCNPNFPWIFLTKTSCVWCTPVSHTNSLNNHICIAVEWEKTNRHGMRKQKKKSLYLAIPFRF